MPNKKGKSAGKTKNAARRGKAAGAKQKKAPAQPTIYICPYTNQNVYICKATLKDLKSKSTYTNSSRKRLWLITSPQVRNEHYVDAAEAIAHMEQNLLPSFGGRSWEVTCKLSEPNWSGQVLFRAWKGQMELAVLPHLLEKIPEPPTWPGKRSRPDEYEETEEDEKGLQQREVSSLSSVAWDLRDKYPVPGVTLKWQSPERKIFHSRKAAWEHATEMAAREVQINKCLLGVGSSGKLLQPFVPSAPMALKVGKLRFERDGLWYVGQELDWQENRPEELEEEEAAEEERKKLVVPKSGLALYIMTKRVEYRQTNTKCTTFREAEMELRKIWKTLSREEKNFWNKQVGKGEDDKDLQVDDQSGKNRKSSSSSRKKKKEAKMDPEVDSGQRQVKLSMTPKAFYVKSRRLEYREERRAQKWSLSLGECDIHLREKWKTLKEEEREDWKQRLIRIEEKKAEERAKEEQEAREKEVREEEKSMTQKKAGDAKSPTYRSDAEEVNLEDPKGVRGPSSMQIQDSEETWNLVKKDASREILCESGDRSGGADPMKEHLGSKTTSKVKEVEHVQPSDPNQLEHRVNKKETIGSESEVKQPHQILSTVQNGADCRTNADILSEKVAEETIKKETQPIAQSNFQEEKKDEDCIDQEAIESAISTKKILAPETTSAGAMLESVDKAKKVTLKSSRKTTSKKHKPTKQASQRWCMTQKQMDQCYTACMDHYDSVMRTVKARDLHRELQDGFDVFRERGRGRYDMELPAFDKAPFQFLSDLNKAPWMPVVKTILGEDVVLIHKGCFLSMPGSAPQEYHQDGVHLTTQTQRPCHAINVFIPLVDLNSRNGPTEFCRGSHILGLEGYDRDFLEVPKPAAGTPVIFDYRLGHRGLGNSSQSCRPIVYCTYARASDGKEFRDSVNFSRKRYHKIGELSSKPLSREERRNKRKQSIETREEEALKKALAESTSNLQTNNASNDDVPSKKPKVDAGPKTDCESAKEHGAKEEDGQRVECDVKLVESARNSLGTTEDHLAKTKLHQETIVLSIEGLLPSSTHA